MDAALARCGLARLAGRLDEEARWDRTLSLGEQQRLAFARALLHRPRWIFLDEATAALDEANHDAMMRLLGDELPASAVVSIGHRPGLDRFHDRVLTLRATPEGAVLHDPGAPKAAAALPQPVRAPEPIAAPGAASAPRQPSPRPGAPPSAPAARPHPPSRNAGGRSPPFNHGGAAP